MTDRSPPLVHALQEAADRMDACAEASPEEAKRCFHEAYTRVIGVRNHLMRGMAGQRDGGAAPPAAGGAPQLRQLNALISLMTSFDFPLVGFHPERLDGARQEISTLLEEARGSCAGA